jgi:putative hydrolase of the HAD superfamily
LITTPSSSLRNGAAVKAVLFDFFGTLVPNFMLSAHKDVLRQMAGAAGAPAEPFVEHWLATFEERATGVFPTARENIQAVCGKLNVIPTDPLCADAVRLRLEFEQRHVAPRATALWTLRIIKSLGLKTCLVSDCSPELPQIWEKTPFAPLFDAAVFSCEVGIRKPNPKIYLEACRRLGVEPSECFFVGDGGSRELSGATQLGMRAVLLAAPEEQKNSDTHRIDGEEWRGPTIYDLKELLPILADCKVVK